MAPRPVMPNAENCSLAELETAAKASPTQRGFVRLMAMRTLLLGHTHGQTAAICAITRRTYTTFGDMNDLCTVRASYFGSAISRVIIGHEHLDFRRAAGIIRARNFNRLQKPR